MKLCETETSISDPFKEKLVALEDALNLCEKKIEATKSIVNQCQLGKQLIDNLPIEGDIMKIAMEYSKLHQVSREIVKKCMKEAIYSHINRPE
jgi:hypothetical protein